MYGDIDVSDLLAIFKIFLLNKHVLSPSPATSQASSSSYSLSLSLSGYLGTLTDYLISKPQAFITSSRFVNTLTNARKNISAHYDISNEMFAAFLSEDMTYSCAIFEELDADVKERHNININIISNNSALALTRNDVDDTKAVKPDDIATTAIGAGTGGGVSVPVHANPGPAPGMIVDALYYAEIRKLKHIIQKADIRKGHRVLEIGTGAFYSSLFGFFSCFISGGCLLTNDHHNLLVLLLALPILPPWSLPTHFHFRRSHSFRPRDSSPLPSSQKRKK